MRLPILMMLMAIALPAFAADGVVAFYAPTRVDVDATGKPVRVEAPADLPEPIRVFIEKRVASWQYTPAMRNGTPQPATTYVQVGACAVPEGKGYRLAVDFKGNGPRLADGKPMLPPPYPHAPLVREVGGDFEVIIAIGADGQASPESIKPLQQSARWNREFESVLAPWVRRMRFDPEVVDGRTVASRMRVPVTFVIGGGSREEMREKRQQDALGKDECRIASGRVSGLQPVALDSPIQVTPSG